MWEQGMPALIYVRARIDANTKGRPTDALEAMGLRSVLGLVTFFDGLLIHASIFPVMRCGLASGWHGAVWGHGWGHDAE